MVLRPRRLSGPLVALLAAGVLFALFVVNMLTLKGIEASRTWIRRARRAEALLSATRASLVDAETGQRGFLLTGREAYLEPFERALVSVPADLAELKKLISDDSTQQHSLAEIDRFSMRKIEELRTTVELQRRGDRAAAMEIVRSDPSKLLMDDARRLITEMRAREDRLLEERTGEARRQLNLAMWVDAGAGFGLLMLGLILYAIDRDIARRKDLEQALRAEVAIQEQFVGILGHDLRNPLAAVLLAAEHLGRAALPAGQATTVARISSSAVRMTRMVEQLLDLTRARLAGGIPVQLRKDTDLGAIARSVVEELGAAHPHATLVVRSDAAVGGAWDPDRLAQLISNLVANGIIHGAGPVEVGVQSAGAFAVLTVHNGGLPIAAEFLPRIFEPFHRPTNPRTRSEGLGLGLFIVERIVAAHSGTIDVRSAEGEGTTFSIRLPVALDSTTHSCQ